MPFRSKAEKVFNFFNILSLSLFCFTTLYPFINILAVSFNDGIDGSLGGITFYPRMFTLENYRVVLNYPSIYHAIFVSISKTIIVTLYSMMVVALSAYALSKKDLIFRKWILLFFIIPMFVNPGLIPVYVNYSKLGLIDKYWIYIIPAGFSFYNMIIIRTYIYGLPNSLEESAYIDGAGYFKIFTSIIVPLSKPALAAVSLFVAVGSWNDWMTTLFFISNEKLYTLQFVLQKILRETFAEHMINEIKSHTDFIKQEEKLKRFTPTSIQMAVLMVTTGPILIVYPFLQKYFVKGVMIGAIKG